jgi:hypothetical protein
MLVIFENILSPNFTFSFFIFLYSNEGVSIWQALISGFALSICSFTDSLVTKIPSWNQFPINFKRCGTSENRRVAG